MEIESIDPIGWRAAKGYANGMLVSGAHRLLFVAGQIAWDPEQRIVGAGDFPAQFAQALRNVAAVVASAGGEPRHVVRMTIYVTDKRAYLENQRALGAAWREVFGRHYPAMALVQVAGLVEDDAMVEIEATAALPAVPRDPASA